MSEILPVYQVEYQLTFDQVFKLPFHTIDKDWYGDPVVPTPRFCVAMDPNHVWLSAHQSCTPHHNSTIRCGSFREGLWNMDVAELFVGQDTSSSYREFNLSPGGAWWSCGFSSYRMPDQQEAPGSNVECFSEVSETSWWASIKIPRPLCPIDSNSRANVCFIVGNSPRQFLSWARVNIPEPDFHVVQCLLPLQIIPFYP